MRKIDALTELLRAELEKSKHLSVRGLASKCKVSYSTMRRILQGKGEPNDDTIVNIVVNLLQVEQAAEYLNTHLPHYEKFLSRFEKKSFVREESDGQLDTFSEAQFLAFMLVYSRGRMSTKDLDNFLGERSKKDCVTSLASKFYLPNTPCPTAPTPVSHSFLLVSPARC